MKYVKNMYYDKRYRCKHSHHKYCTLYKCNDYVARTAPGCEDKFHGERRLQRQVLDYLDEPFKNQFLQESFVCCNSWCIWLMTHLCPKCFKKKSQKKIADFENPKHREFSACWGLREVKVSRCWKSPPSYGYAAMHTGLSGMPPEFFSSVAFLDNVLEVIQCQCPCTLCDHNEVTLGNWITLNHRAGKAFQFSSAHEYIMDASRPAFGRKSPQLGDFNINVYILWHECEGNTRQIPMFFVVPI